MSIGLGSIGIVRRRKGVPSLSTAVTPQAAGTVFPDGVNSYTKNQKVSVTATANSNWVFDHWELDGANVGSANPYTVTMDDDHLLVAVFKTESQSGTGSFNNPIPNPTIDVTVDTGGDSEITITDPVVTFITSPDAALSGGIDVSVTNTPDAALSGGIITTVTGEATGP